MTFIEKLNMYLYEKNKSNFYLWEILGIQLQ